MVSMRAVPVAASDIAIENAGFSNATIAIAMPDGFEPAPGMAYDIAVNLAVPTYTSGASCTIGGTYLYGRGGGYKRFPMLRAPFILRVQYGADPERYAFVSMRPVPWTLCA